MSLGSSPITTTALKPCDDVYIMRMISILMIGLALPVFAAGTAVARADVQALSPYDVQNPAVGYLNPALLAAVQQASAAAASDGVVMTITSGWRSPEFQQQLLDDAVATYGSLAAARQFVQTPQRSHHVQGSAVDIGGVAADHWLEANGGRFGLCRTYANEIWHFELTADAAGNCPLLLPDASG